ncbi:MAG: class I SAM-dependent methyltransferase [Candidatus Binatia bacterium]|nr:class I SAM-dependent methyltransferase [Candidatus Binatia bacterium]
MNTKAEIVEAVRLEQLLEFAPEVFAPGTLLYIGASVRRAHCLADLIKSGRDVTILEAWPENVEYFREQPDVEVFCGDVREIASIDLMHDLYDVAFWWHGPEHVHKEELVKVLAAVERRSRMIVLASPWGISSQTAIDGNEYEKHLSSLYPEDFEEMGYEVSTIGQPNGRAQSNILAVKR